MCGRYVSPDQAAIERAVEVQRKSWASRFADAAVPFDASYNVSPSHDVPIVRVIREADGQREGVHLRWGLVPDWAAGVPTKYSTVNARVETVRTSAVYRAAWRRGQRCLVALSGFYEWQAQPPDWQRTVPHYITVLDQDPFFLAGLWDRSVRKDGVVIESCTVITVPANALMAEIHNSKKAGAKRVLLPLEERRMPAILEQKDHDTWLTGSAEEAFVLLKPYLPELMKATPVSNRVNSTRNNDPQLVQPWEIDPPGTLL